MRTFASALLLGILLICSACSRSSQDGPDPRPPGAATPGSTAPAGALALSLTGLPALPPSHLAAGVVIEELTGSSAVDQSSNAVGDGSVMKLTPGPGETSWAIYELSFGNDLPLYVDADFVCVDPQNPNNEGAYIALGDYSRNAWEFYGPFGGRQVLPLDAGKHKSPTDSFVIAIILPPLEQSDPPQPELEIRELTLLADHFNSPPTAVLQANRLSGNATLRVIFNAGASTDPDGNISRYLWDFNDNGSFEESSTSTGIEHAFDEPGIHTVRMAVEDADGERDTASINIDVNVSGNTRPVADIVAIPTGGEAPLEITLNAGTGSIDSDGTIVRFDWDFDGNGTWDVYDGPAAVDHWYSKPGVFNPRVRVTDDDGAQTFAELVFELLGTNEAMIVDDVGGWFAHLNAAIVNGMPAVSYTTYDLFWGDVHDQRYARALDEQGVSWGTPQIMQSGGLEDYGEEIESALTSKDGRPIFCYGMNQGFGEAIRIWWASDSQLGSWGTFALFGDEFGPGPHDIEAELLDIYPAIIWWDSTTLRFARILDLQFPESGQSVGTWVLDIDTDDPQASMALINGAPAVSYTDYGHVRFVLANDPQGDSWSSTVTVRSPSGIEGLAYSSLAEIGGRPAIAFSDLDSGNIEYVRAEQATGTSWPNPEFVFLGEVPDLAEIAGKPAICAIAQTGLRYRRATDVDGLNWAPTKLLDSQGSAGEILEVPGGAGVAYHRFAGSVQICFVNVL